MDKTSRYISLALTVATWGWDVYAQAHGIPYKIDDVWKGIIWAPFAKWGIDKAITGGKKLLKKPDPKS